jgi:hypothetical protein
MLVSIYQLIVACIVFGFLAFQEYLDWYGRADVLKTKHPKLWALMDKRRTRLILLVVVLVFLVKDFHDAVAIAPAPIVRTTPPPASIIAPRPTTSTKPPSSHPEVIGSFAIELRLSCSLRDPSRLPVDLVIHVPSDSTFLESQVGRVFLEVSNGVHYQRLDEEGMAYAVQFYQLPSNSSLLGQPLRTLLEYDRLRFSMDGVDGKNFKKCIGFELIVKVNGRETLREAEKLSVALPSQGGSIVATIRLVGMNLGEK